MIEQRLQGAFRYGFYRDESGRPVVAFVDGETNATAFIIPFAEDAEIDTFLRQGREFLLKVDNVNQLVIPDYPGLNGGNN